MSSERALLDVTQRGAHHAHRLRVVALDHPGGEETVVELSEPDKCACIARLPLSELVHLVLNTTAHEMLVVPNRDLDAAGHAHESP